MNGLARLLVSGKKEITVATSMDTININIMTLTVSELTKSRQWKKKKDMKMGRNGAFFPFLVFLSHPATGLNRCNLENVVD